MLELAAAGDKMQEACTQVNGFQEQTAVKILHNFIAASIFPCYELVEGSAGNFVESDEGRTLHANS